MILRRVATILSSVATYLLINTHPDTDCASTYAAWRGSSSRLRGGVAWSGCLHGDHRIFWRVEAGTTTEAIGLLPPFIAGRTVATPVRPMPIP